MLSLGHNELMSIVWSMAEGLFRADSRLAPSQWERALQSKAVSHWLSANLESAMLFRSLNTLFNYTPMKLLGGTLSLSIHLSVCPTCLFLSVAHCLFHGLYSYVAQMQPIRGDFQLNKSTTRSHTGLDINFLGHQSDRASGYEESLICHQDSCDQSNHNYICASALSLNPPDRWRIMSACP